jgi:hypothetical protein
VNPLDGQRIKPLGNELAVTLNFFVESVHSSHRGLCALQNLVDMIGGAPERVNETRIMAERFD